MADELWRQSASDLADGIRQRKVSCREVMDSVVGRIRARNGALNAIVYDYTEEALAEARRAGIVLCPGVGFDVVPTDCIALTLKQAMPDATRLALGFDSRSGMSRGTASTSVEGLGHGSRVREDGEIRRIPLGSRSRQVDFGAGPKLATAIPWGDVSTAFRTTGIPDIEVYVPVSPKALANLRRLGNLGWLLRRRPVQALLKWRIRQGAPGPSASERERTPVHVWGEARNAAGRTLTARVRVPNGYTVTTDAAVAIARRLLESPPPPGFTTPARLMGAAFASAMRRGCQPRWCVGPEKPKPGSDGATTWKASDASPP